MADTCNGCGNDREPATRDAVEIVSALRTANRLMRKATEADFWEAGYRAGVQQALAWVIQKNAAHPFQEEN